jgi:hypothetical protein
MAASQFIRNPILSSPRVANRTFGWDTPGQIVSAMPRMRFMFFVEFFPSSGALAMMPNATLNTISAQGISFKVKTIDKPKITPTVDSLNQYNKKVVVYKKVEYGEAIIRLHDSVDNSILALWINYFTYYFGDSRQKNDQAYAQSPIDGQFVDGSGWGFRPLSDVTSFFSKITVHALYANTTTKFSYINPKISGIDWQTKDASSSDPEEVTINFKYEAIKYEALGDPISSAQTFGFETNEIVDYAGGSGQYSQASARIFQSTNTNIANNNTVQTGAQTTETQTTASPGTAPGASVPSSTNTNGQNLNYGTPPT